MAGRVAVVTGGGGGIGAAICGLFAAEGPDVVVALQVQCLEDDPSVTERRPPMAQ